MAVITTIIKNKKLLLLNKIFFLRPKPVKDNISFEVSCFVKSLKQFNENGDEWIIHPYSESEDNLGVADIKKEYGSLTYYEQSCNELYLDKSVIKGSKVTALDYVVEYLDSYLNDKFSNKTFFIVASIQFGRYSSITAKLCSFRKNEALIENFDDCKQPVLQAIIET